MSFEAEWKGLHFGGVFKPAKDWQTDVHRLGFLVGKK